MRGMNEEFIPTRETLLIRLRNWKDDQSWKEFFDTYWKLIYTAAIKAGLQDVEAQEVVQETIIHLAKVMPDFRYDRKVGSFKGFLQIQTQWRIKDQLRKRAREMGRSGALAQVIDPHESLVESYWDEEWERNLLDVAQERVKKKVNPKHYQIFDLNVNQRWPAAKVAEALGVKTTKVHLARHRITRLLAAEIKELKAREQK